NVHRRLLRRLKVEVVVDNNSTTALRQRPPPVHAFWPRYWLVIKIGTLVDEVELRDGEISFTPLPAAPLWVKLLHPSDLGSCVVCALVFRSSRAVGANGIQELGHFLQGNTVLQVVRCELVFEPRCACCFPLSPPHDALNPRSLCVRPMAAEVSADLLQTI